MEELKNDIEKSEVQVHAKIKKETNYLLVRDVLDDSTAKIERAESTEYTHRAIVKVKGQSPVHEYSGLEHSGHILDDGKSIYNTTLNKSDLLTGVNRATMMEFAINLSEMPLGKLSKYSIQKGFEALTQIQNLLNSTAHAPSIRESLLVDASNRFFTVIPSVCPKVIKDEDDFKSKEWALELEEVFSIEREGELDKYAPYRAKLKNKKLLWHGSRLTNFVGILSQGLRIAPPAVPVTGYMFGKGIYFADMVSKSAQYCYTSPKNPVGLILSEVALGEVYELKKSKYIDTPPEGKNSTIGLGKKVPRISEHVNWRDGIIVPCGKPVSSRVNGTDLMYNEYIVYDTAQVKLQFLLKVRFHHKRRRGQ